MGLLAAGVIVILLVALALAWRQTSEARRSSMDNGVTEQQARENAAPLTTAILSGSRNLRAQPERTSGSAPRDRQ
jgi:CHASE3 domain sensor protein